jgi:hypothetical protein
MSARDIPINGERASSLERDFQLAREADAPGFNRESSRAALLDKVRAGLNASERERLDELMREEQASSPALRRLPPRAVWFLAAALALVAVSAIAIGGRTWFSRSQTSSTSSQPAAAQGPAPERAPATAEASALPLPSAAPMPPEQTATPEQRRRERTLEAPAKDDLVLREIAQMREIRASLASEPSKALALAEAGHVTFARGMLYEEREAHAILALTKLGQRDAARQRAKRFLTRSPHGPFSQRVREAVGMR